MEWTKKLPEHAAVGVGVFLLVLILVTLSKKLYEQRRTNPAVLKKGAICVRRASDHAIIAQQVKNPLLALTKANYALAYLSIARDLALDDELSQATNIPIEELQEDVEREEQKARDRILKLCPHLAMGTRSGASAGYFRKIAPQTTLPNYSEQIRRPVSQGVIK
jgi:hypothetical protein